MNATVLFPISTLCYELPPYFLSSHNTQRCVLWLFLLSLCLGTDRIQYLYLKRLRHVVLVHLHSHPSPSKVPSIINLACLSQSAKKNNAFFLYYYTSYPSPLYPSLDIARFLWVSILAFIDSCQKLYNKLHKHIHVCRLCINSIMSLLHQFHLLFTLFLTFPTIRNPRCLTIQMVYKSFHASRSLTKQISCNMAYPA